LDTVLHQGGRVQLFGAVWQAFERAEHVGTGAPGSRQWRRQGGEGRSLEEQRGQGYPHVLVAGGEETRVQVQDLHHPTRHRTCETRKPQWWHKVPQWWHEVPQWWHTRLQSAKRWHKAPKQWHEVPTRWHEKPSVMRWHRGSMVVAVQWRACRVWVWAAFRV